MKKSNNKVHYILFSILRPPSPTSHLLPLNLISPLSSPISHLSSPISHLSSPISHLNSSVSNLLSLTSHVSCPTLCQLTIMSISHSFLLKAIGRFVTAKIKVNRLKHILTTQRKSNFRCPLINGTNWIKGTNCLVLIYCTCTKYTNVYKKRVYPL